jgi:hypothetical protein
MFREQKFSWFILLLIFCLYLFLPSGFSTTDGWAYAASIKQGENIFHPHHLLYNALGVVFSWLPSKAGFEILSCMKVMNAIFALLTLLVVQHILYSFKLPEKHVILISSLAGFSFAMIRYATENETYIVPLFFALMASLNYLKFTTTGNNTYSLYTALWASFAVLFHLIYLFWWLVLLAAILTEKRKAPALRYIIMSLIVPLVYFIVIITSEGGSDWNDILGFLTGDFKENARLELSPMGIFLSVINLVRSFIQVHGYIFHMIRANILTIIPGVVSVIFVVLALLAIPEKGKSIVSKRFCRVHILIVILQFVFAMFSSGNAEFMVMIPVLVFILIPFFTISYEKFLLRILISMVIWNISYGLVPLNNKKGIQEQFLCDLALSGKNVIIVASDDQLIKEMIHYQSGENDNKSVLKAPSLLKIKGKDPAVLKGIIDSALYAGTDIYTNCLDENIVSRSSILEGSVNKEFFLRYKTTLIKSWDLNTGTRSVYKVTGRL